MGRPAYGVRGIELIKSDYLVGLAATPLERKKNGDGEHSPSLILSITEQATASVPMSMSTGCRRAAAGRD